jgi:DNA-binding MarR family transcriptional regulator
VRTISTTDLAHRLRPAVTRLARRMRQRAVADLTPTQGAALATIDIHGPLTPSELAARERIQRPTATRVLARLEEAGLVTRTSDPADRRSSLVSTTASGQALLAEVRDRKDAYLAQRLGRLSPEDLAALERAAGILERMLEEDGGE